MKFKCIDNSERETMLELNNIYEGKINEDYNDSVYILLETGIKGYFRLSRFEVIDDDT